MAKPNIIFYFSDQQRYDTLAENITPHLFSLAKEGVNITNAYTCQPVCGPARACLQTGLYASQNGCYINGVSLKEETQTIAKLFNQNGYETAYVGKWHLASDNFGKHFEKSAIPVERRGGYKDYWMASDCLEFTSNGYGGYVFDINNEKVTFNGIRADAINDFALDYIKNKVSDKPFFMFISQLDPHHQNSTDKYECPRGSGDKFKNYPIPQDLTAFKGNYKDRYADYLACCERLDYNIDKLAQTLKEQGIWDNTIVIYTSDHGCHFRTRNGEYKRSCHDSSIHIPMIMFGGYIKSPVKYDGLVSLIDIPTTLLALAEISTPKEFMGKDIFKLICGEQNRENVYVQISESQLGRAIRTSRYTYSVKKRKSLGIEAKESSKYIEDKLYDNLIDPHQLSNLISNPKYNAVKEDLRLQLLKNIELCGEKPAKISKRWLWHSRS